MQRRVEWILAAAGFLLGLLGPRLARAEFRPFSAPYDWDRAERFVESFRHQTLEEIRDAGLESARLHWQPWSDSYWPVFAGGIAVRYADPELPSKGEWSDYSAFLLKSLGSRPTEMLSPAEKYDLLVGNPDFNLTRGMLDYGARLARDGKVDTWIGFCTGWAAASITYPRPRHSVTVTAVDGKTQLVLRPSDLKAYAALLWAQADFPIRFIGGRCEAHEPERDSVGRPVDPICLDTNPATWHRLVVEQLGVRREAFLIDAELKDEVWNHPLFAYQYEYFNPATGEEADTLEEAKVKLADFAEDRFAAFRSPYARSVVGIQMIVTYSYEVFPSVSLSDDESQDVTMSEVYRYDLELDRWGRIVGGEWHSKRHPDFIWAPERGALARSVMDGYLSDSSEWDLSRPLPRDWASAARGATSYLQPLGRLVETLFEAAAE
ncbi:MAG: hypothetical protein NDJ90_07305 [Oligoflexia bacterium]|nr:hypothetical protein [Oligoflexia bacterium]